MVYFFYVALDGWNELVRYLRHPWSAHPMGGAGEEKYTLFISLFVTPASASPKRTCR
jgi:hypothetical protein